MSVKRPADDDEQLTTNPDSAFEDPIPSQHKKMMSSNATTLLDLPMELHEHILLEAILSEIRDRKLFRCAWKESGERVVERLKTVCRQWNNVLTSDLFRIRLHALIDTFPSVKITLNVVDEHYYSSWCIAVDALDDEFFLLCRQKPPKHAAIRICDGDDLEKAKATIELPSVTAPWNLVASSVSSCVYVLHRASDSVEILRISKVDDQFQVSPFITCSVQLVTRMCVSADGCPIVFQGPAPSTVTTYGSDGSIQRQVHLTRSFSFVRDILSKSNGNVIVVSGNLTEIKPEGDVLRDYDIREGGGYRGHICCAVDSGDSILTVDVGGSVRLLDSDFNQAEVRLHKLTRIRCWRKLYQLHYNRQRNQFFVFDCCDADPIAEDRPSQCLDIFVVTQKIVLEGEDNDDDLKFFIKVKQIEPDQNGEGAQNEGGAQNGEGAQNEEDDQNEDDDQSEEDDQNDDDSLSDKTAPGDMEVQNEEDAQNEEGAQNEEDDQNKYDSQSDAAAQDDMEVQNEEGPQNEENPQYEKDSQNDEDSQNEEDFKKDEHSESKED